MCDAGRIKHHLRNNLPNPNATVLFVGYQAQGTLGQIIKSGAEEVRIHGKEIRVRATIRSIGNYSAHADHSELVSWIADRLPAHGAIFLTHGEDDSRTALKAALAEKGLGADLVVAPQLDDMFELRTTGIAARAPAQIERIDPAQLRNDWTAEFARFSIDLNHILAGVEDDETRLAIVKQLAATLDKAKPGPGAARPG
jgi:metallo-beta-lactamase family protein